MRRARSIERTWAYLQYEFHGGARPGPGADRPRLPFAVSFFKKMEGLQRAENPTEEYPKVSSETLMGEGVALRGLRPRWRLRRPRHIGLLMRCSRAARSMSRASARSQRCCGLRPQRPLAARPSAALAPSAPAGTCIGMRLSRAGQSNLARLLARKPWTPRAFHAKTM